MGSLCVKFHDLGVKGKQLQAKTILVINALWSWQLTFWTGNQ